MRVLIVTGIFPPDIGGPATYVPMVAAGLAVRGHQVTVVTLSEERRRAEDGRYPFQVVRLLRRRPRLLRIVRTAQVLWRFGRRADVLFVNGLALESVLANVLLRKPLVMKVVGDLAWEKARMMGWTSDSFEVFQKKRYRWRAELLKALRSWWTRRAKRVIVPSRYLLPWVAEWGLPEERIEVIYNALEPVDRVRPLAVPLSTPVKVVHVGRLVPWKRVDRILRAVEELPEAGLVVVGDGPERSRLEALARALGIQKRVYFAGSRGRQETLGLMAGCDLFVLNSTYEGLPHVVLEAMALGLPVVATAVGGTPELVRDGETGVLLNGGDDKLPLVLRDLIRGGQTRSRMATAAMGLARTRFGLETMVQETEEVLRAVTSP